MTTIVEARQQAPENTSSGTDHSFSDPEKSDNGDDEDEDSRDVPMSNWEEFDADAAYQKKHVDPEMRQWVLTKDCRRIISDKFFNNPAHDQGVRNLLPRSQSDCIVFSVPIGLVLR